MRRPADRWLVLAALTLARTAMGFQFQAVGAVSPLLMERLAVGYAELGILVGLFSLPGVAVALPGGLLGERFGDRRVVLAGLALMTLGSVLLGLASTFAVAVLGRFLTAVGAVVLNVLVTTMVADRFAAHEVVWPMTILINAWPIGIGAALLVLPPLARVWASGAAFHAAAGMAALGFAAVVTLHRPGPGDRPTRAGGPAAALTRAETARVAVAAAPWMLYNVGYAVMLSFVPALLVHRGASVEQAGLLLGVTTLLFIVSVQAGGAAAHRLVSPEVVVVVGLLGFGGGLLALPHAPAVATLVLTGVLGGLPAGALVAAPTRALRPQSRARGMGVFYTAYYLGMTVLPPVAGWLQDVRGGATATVLAAAAVLLTLPAYLCFAALARATALLVEPVPARRRVSG